MTDITVTVVNARSMHIAHHRRDTLNKHTLYANIWRVSRPVSTVIFQTYGWCQIFGNNNEVLVSGFMPFRQMPPHT